MRLLDKTVLIATLMGATLPSISYAQTITDATQDHLTLVGITVNGIDKESIDILQQDNLINQSVSYYLPLGKVGELTGLKPTLQSNHWVIETPLGQANLSTSLVPIYNNSYYISLIELKKLGITAAYNPSDLAVQLNVPWHIDTSKNPKESANNLKPVAEYQPDQAGILGVNWRVNANQKTDKNSEPSPNKSTRNLTTTLGAFGYVQGGIWGINTEATLTKQDYPDNIQPLPNQKDTRLTNLYWAKSGDKFATRLGVSQSGTSSDLITDYTGLSVAYSNKDINRHLATMSETTRRLLQGTYEDYQHIEGKGPAGGVAELRINGQAIARVQIALDKQYEFLNLDMNQWLTPGSTIEIALYDYPNAKQPLSIRRLNLGRRHSNVATNELLLETNLGYRGNQFADETQENAIVTSLYGEYGVSNRLAIRGGIGKDDKTIWQAGFNATTSTYSNLDINYLNQKDSNEFQLDWQYQVKKFYADYRYQKRHYSNPVNYLGNRTQLGDRNSQDNLTDERHSLYLTYQPNTNLNLALSQYYTQLGYQSHDYSLNFLANMQISPQLNTGLSFDSLDNRYNYRLAWQSPNKPLNIGFVTDNDEDQVTLQHRLNERTLLTHTLSKLHQDSQLLYGVNLSYQPTFYQLFNVGYNIYNGEHGWDINWQYFKHDGLRLSAGYRQHDLSYRINKQALPEVNTRAKDDSYAYLELSMNWWQPPSLGLTLGNYAPQKAGSVVVDVIHDKIPAIDSPQMQFNVGNKTIIANLIHKGEQHTQYLLSDIKPGIYQIGADGKDIPFDYDTSKLPTPYVKVAKYTPTIVPLRLQKAYGISGDIGVHKAQVNIEIWQKDNLLQTVVTDDTGHFQSLGLINGQYQIRASGYQTKAITLNNDFVLGIKLDPKSITP